MLKNFVVCDLQFYLLPASCLGVDCYLERSGFCLTGMHTLGQESVAPIYVQT